MVTKEYIVDHCEGAYKALDTLQQEIACTIDFAEANGTPWRSVCITCQEKDLAIVEQYIAPYV